jgi:ATP-dependent protease ClpP protease subunit
MAPKRKSARPRAALRQGRTDWYRIENNAGTGTVAVYIYDEIGYFGVTASDFVAQLSAIDAAEIHLYVNSPGGEIFDGIAIHNCLRSHTARVVVQVDSLAASIASVIAMAGDQVVMAPHSQMMIHDGSGLAIGNAEDMREMAELLDRQSDNIAGIYAERAGGTAGQWRKRMQAETWYTAREAVEAGLADEVAKPARRPEEEPAAAHALAASWDLSVFRYEGREQAPAPTPADGETPLDPVAMADGLASRGDEPSAPAAELAGGWDPELFRAGLARATGHLADWDPELFRDAVDAQASNAPAPTTPEPAADPEPAAEPEVEPDESAPEGPYDPEVLRSAVQAHANNAPAPTRQPDPDPEPAAPEPEPPPRQPDPEPLSLGEIFRAAVRTQANNAPAPTERTPDEPEPDLYDATVVTRALREAGRS